MRSSSGLRGGKPCCCTKSGLHRPRTQRRRGYSGAGQFGTQCVGVFEQARTIIAKRKIDGHRMSGRSEFGGQRRQQLGALGGEHYLVTAADKLPGHRPPDARGGSGDHDGLIRMWAG